MATKRQMKGPALKRIRSARDYKRTVKQVSTDPAHELEIIFTGLCSFLNLTNTNGTMPPPSVILPRTSDDDEHTPFIAFNTADVKVTTSGGGAEFVPVEKAPDFQHRTLDGVLLKFREDSVGWPVVLPSYALVAQKDCYWPEAKNHWDRDYVPAGDDEPDSKVVAAYMPLGAGTIAAERLTDFEWEFVAEDGRCTQRAYYAQEVIYRIYPFRSKQLTLVLRRLDNKSGSDKKPVKEIFTFTVARANSTKIKIWIGNSDEIHKSLLRLSSAPKRAIHFEHLNDVSGFGGSGPIPSPIVPRDLFLAADVENAENEGQPKKRPGTGSDTGYCGPHNPGGV